MLSTGHCNRVFTDRRILFIEDFSGSTRADAQASTVFSDVDVAFAMSRCCILPPRACVPPSMSSYLLFELVLRACTKHYVWICMTVMTTVMYLLHFQFLVDVTS